MNSTTPSQALIDAALLSESILYGRAVGAPPIGGGRLLLVKPLQQTPTTLLTLKQIQADAAWASYTDLREPADRLLGNYRSDTERFITAMRERAKRLALKWWFAYEGENIVGAVGMMTLASDGWYGRLQDLMIFPEHRGRGLANQLLAAIEIYGLDLGLAGICVDADEDTWQVSWYERRGYLNCARIGRQDF